MKRVLAVLLFSLVTARLFGGEPPPLGRVDAKLILEFMDWKEVTVIAIRQGVDAKGSVAPIYATVIGLGKCRGHYQNICQTVFYDADLDWHLLELAEKSARVWNKLGISEIKPWATW